MPKNLFPMDNTKKFKDQKLVGHNRWHPDIPAAVTVKPGEVFRADVREWFDGAIHNDDSADDVRNAPLPGVHVLTGPFHVEGAEPGDLLIVDIFMPGMDGIATIREVRRHQPDLPAIVISGTSVGGGVLNAPGLQAPDFLAMAIKLGAVRSLQKPFKPRDIIAVVDQCLAGAAEKQTGTG